MEPESDLPYVRGDGRNIMSQPVFSVGMVNWTNRSDVTSGDGDAFELLAEADVTVSNRFISHVGDVDGPSIWINFLGGDAAAHAPGSIELIPGDIMPIPTRARVTAFCVDDGVPFTTAEG